MKLSSFLFYIMLVLHLFVQVVVPIQAAAVCNAAFMKLVGGPVFNKGIDILNSSQGADTGINFRWGATFPFYWMGRLENGP